MAEAEQQRWAEQLARSNRAGAIAEYAKVRGVSRHLAEQAIAVAERARPA